MSCKQCASINQRAFNGEVAVHFPGRRSRKTHRLVFSSLTVCFDCGGTEFTIPKRELSVLVQGVPVEGATVLTERISRPSTRKGKERNTVALTGIEAPDSHSLCRQSSLGLRVPSLRQVIRQSSTDKLLAPKNGVHSLQ
jgi:hypothetical protein